MKTDEVSIFPTTAFTVRKNFNLTLLSKDTIQPPALTGWSTGDLLIKLLNAGAAGSPDHLKSLASQDGVWREIPSS